MPFNPMLRVPLYLPWLLLRAAWLEAPLRLSVRPGHTSGLGLHKYHGRDGKALRMLQWPMSRLGSYRAVKRCTSMLELLVI